MNPIPMIGPVLRVTLNEAPTGFESVLLDVIEAAALLVEILAVAIIIIATLTATFIYLRRVLTRTAGREGYEQYKVRLGRGLLLGLEILVAADIVRTVALEPSLTNVAILALLVLVRTFLSWSLVVEIEHRWPWRPRTAEHIAAVEIHDEVKKHDA